MKKALCTSLCVAAGCAAARWVELHAHPEYPAPGYLPIAIAFIGSFIGASAVLLCIRLFRRLL